jgi:hypothetical protein
MSSSAWNNRLICASRVRMRDNEVQGLEAKSTMTEVGRLLPWLERCLADSIFGTVHSHSRQDLKQSRSFYQSQETKETVWSRI